MSRLDYGATIPGARRRFAQAGSRMAIDNAPVYVEASGDEPITLDLSHTSMLQVLAAELRESGLLIDFLRVALNPHDPEVQQQVLPRLRVNERVTSALTLTWTAGMAYDVAAQLEQAADVAESDDHDPHQFAAGATAEPTTDLTTDDDTAEVPRWASTPS